MRVALLAALTLCVSAVPLRAQEQPAEVSSQPYAREARVRSIKAALDALGTFDNRLLLGNYGYLLIVERSRCRAPILSLKVECLMVAAKDNCRGASRQVCLTVADLMISNRLGENTLISQEEKLDLMKAQGGGTFRDRFERELRRRYASLVLEMKLRSSPEELEGENLPATIESYCREVSSTRALAWQHCASAVIWFISTSERPEIPGKDKR